MNKQEKTPHVLVVDDDPAVLNSITRVLREHNFRISGVTSGQDALDFLQEETPDLIILDVVMPGINGFDLCSQIRNDPYRARIPIIFLTARTSSEDAIIGFQKGADDYLKKPFEVIELPARLRAILRRSPGDSSSSSDYLEIGELKLHTSIPEVEVAGETIRLTTTEHHLLYYLMKNAGQPVSVEKLLNSVWGYPPGAGHPKLVSVHITNLRTKIEQHNNIPRYIHNVRGRGYMVNGGQ